MTALGLTLRAEATLQSLTEEVIKTSEQQAEPALRGLPVIVAPVMTDTTSAIAASYEARAFGIKTRTPIWEVKKKCPGLKE